MDNEEQTQPQQEPEEQPGGPGQTAEAGAAAEEKTPLDVYALLNYSLALMRDYAWQAMGLVPNAGSGQIERNLEQAQVAIDTAAFLADKLAPTLPEDDRSHLRSMIRDLKINFVQQQGKG